MIQAKYDKREEFRRHVTMIAHLDNEKDYDVNIDVLYEYFAKAKEFITYLEENLE